MNCYSTKLRLEVTETEETEDTEELASLDSGLSFKRFYPLVCIDDGRSYPLISFILAIRRAACSARVLSL